MPRLETLGSVVHVVSIKPKTFKVGKTNRITCIDVSGNALDFPMSDFIWLDYRGQCERLCYRVATPVSGVNTAFKVAPHKAYPELSVVSGKNIKMVINRRHHRYYKDEK